MPLVLRDDSTIETYDLAARRERNEEWYVGREDIQCFVALPERWCRLVLRIDTLGTPTLAKLREEFVALCAGDPRALATADQDVKLLLIKLVQLKFIKAVNGTPLQEEDAVRRDLFPSVKRRHVAWFFSSAALVVQALFILGGLAAVAARPQLMPSLGDYFWSRYPGLNFLTGLALSWLVVLIHELFHLFAARALYIQGRLRLNTRLLSIIVETDVTNIFKASRRQRAVVYAAGMLANLLLFSAGAYALLAANALHPVLRGLLGQAMLLVGLMTVWQLQFHLKTDLYLLLANALSAPNLAREGAQALHAFGDRLRGKPARATTRRGRWFALAMALGAPLSILFYAATSGAILFRILRDAGYALLQRAGALAIADALLAYLLFAALLGIFFAARRRKT